MDMIAGVFSPPLLAVLCCIAVATAAVLFVLARRGGGGILDLRTPLSWADPVEIRLVLYLILGAACGAGALVIRLLFEMATAGSILGWLLLVLVLLGFVGNLAFFYAAAGSLLQAALGSRGRPPFWFSPLLSAVDGLIMDAGDYLTRILINPAPVNPMRRERVRERYNDGLDAGYYDAPPQRRAGRPPSAAHTATAQPVVDDIQMEDEYLPSEEVETPPARTRGSRAVPARDIPRERLDLALQEYEAALTPMQLQKFREMRSLIEYLQQCA